MNEELVTGFVCARCGLRFRPFRTWPVGCDCGALHHQDGRMTRARTRWWHVGDRLQDVLYWTGIAQWYRAKFPKACGCKVRQERLNGFGDWCRWGWRVQLWDWLLWLAPAGERIPADGTIAGGADRGTAGEDRTAGGASLRERRLAAARRASDECRPADRL